MKPEHLISIVSKNFPVAPLSIKSVFFKFKAKVASQFNGLYKIWQHFVSACSSFSALSPPVASILLIFNFF